LVFLPHWGDESLEKLGLIPGSRNEETKEKYLELARPGI